MLECRREVMTNWTAFLAGVSEEANVVPLKRRSRPVAGLPGDAQGMGNGQRSNLVRRTQEFLSGPRQLLNEEDLLRRWPSAKKAARA